MYDSAYYDRFRGGSYRSARVIVPLILEWIAPKSVIDVGCGVGDWLSVFRESGVSDILGLDGDYVQRRQLAIPESDFHPHNLETPYRSERRYDLAMSLEVAEHLPAEYAPGLVRSLTELAPVVLFSAAVPNQPGDRHVNCQWPVYWARLFQERDYVAVDALRLRVWENSQVDWWYRQNILLYVSANELKRSTTLQAMREPLLPSPPALVHPEMFLEIYRNMVAWGCNWENKYWELWQAFKSVEGSSA